MKKKFVIIGNPIKHSLSPVLHEYWFKKYNIDADYSIMEATDKDLPQIIEKVKQGFFSGINVTLPFKQKIINYVDKVVNDAELTGSVNTVFLNNNKTVIGENTDVYGLQAAYLKEIDNCSNKKALIVGAGGVSSSVILSIQKSGIRNISITNRTNEKCIFLKKKFNFLNIIPWVELKAEIKNFDIIINATSLGLKKEDNLNLDFSSISRNKFFYDVIYNPSETNFLKTGREMGNKTLNGKLMFIYQAISAFNIWHGVKPKVNDEVIKFLD